MAKTREIVDRRKSVLNIRKITRTMEMISTSRFKKAHQRIVDARPYSEQLYHLLATMMSWHTPPNHPLLVENPDARRRILVVLTSRRGLCGGYNTNVVRLALERIGQIEAQRHEAELWVWGKKGIGALRFNRRQVDRPLTQLSDKIKYRPVEVVTNELMDRYTAGELGGVDVVYTEFESAARHYPHLQQLLPLKDPAQYHFERRRKLRLKMQNYLFSPPAKDMLDLLIPAVVRQELFQCFLDAYASEQAARMRAMKAATENAEQMIETLSRKYNRLRQSQITGELLDILGGAEALK
ncbi:MAG: ATP synthase F1 subunit gamma [Sedimentisphaerales bacterium]|nr:ATP synthase F1 subunit gamma [Sedimentisphaerales bacterium]